MADYTTTALLSSIKTRALVPTSQQTFEDSDILALATDELRLGVVPFMMKNRSEYFVTTTDVAIEDGVDTYSIPTRAIGGKVKGLTLVDSNGSVLDFPQIDPSERPQYNSTSWTQKLVFYFQGNSIVVCPNPVQAQGLSIRISYFTRPGELVAVTDAAQVASISGNDVTVTYLPSTISTGVSVDTVKQRPGFECLSTEDTVTVVGSVVTFTSAPEDLAVGDWICLAEQSTIPQIPVELHPLLAQRTAIKLLESLGDAAGVQVAQAKLKEMEEGATHLLSPRSDSNPRKLINVYSTLRRR